MDKGFQDTVVTLDSQVTTVTMESQAILDILETIQDHQDTVVGLATAASERQAIAVSAVQESVVTLAGQEKAVGLESTVYQVSAVSTVCRDSAGSAVTVD